MSRIKYILNERRLGIIAAGAAQAGIHGVHVPTTVGGMNDPIAAVEALGGARAPDMAALLPPRMKKAVEEMYEEEVGEIEAPKEEAKAAEAEAEAKEVKKE
jgi:hypothetical protein